MNPQPTDPRKAFVLAHFLGLFGLIGWFWITGSLPAADAGPALNSTPRVEAVVPDQDTPTASPKNTLPKRAKLPRGVDLLKAKVKDGKLVQTLKNGDKVTFTVDPAAQAAALRLLKKRPHRFGALVAIEPATGRVLAFAENVKDPDASNPHPALEATAPAASVFKIITAAALLEAGAVRPADRVCVHGGLRRLSPSNILGNKKLDNRCRRFGVALAHSDNSIYARLAHRHLDTESLLDTAESFGFGDPLDLPWPAAISKIELPEDDRLEFARAAAGFWHTTLSPVHAATIAAGIANDGQLMRPRLVEEIADAQGEITHSESPIALRRFVKKKTARILGGMMRQTTRSGTAHKTFSKRWPHRDIEVAGKTGSLARRDPDYLSYSWFVGFAPVENPRIAVAALVGNRARWHIKGSQLAREVLAAYFRSHPQASTNNQPSRLASR